MQPNQPKPSKNNNISYIKKAAKKTPEKQLAWTCSCDHTFPKEDTQLSGYPSGSQGLHVHCPRCGKVVAQFIKTKNEQT